METELVIKLDVCFYYCFIFHTFRSPNIDVAMTPKRT